MKLREQLNACLTDEKFEAQWTRDTPPFALFLDVAAEKLAAVVGEPVTELTAVLGMTDERRARIDGRLTSANGPMTYYLELVWLPKFESFRGNAHVSPARPEPKAKSVDEFIRALDAIVHEEEIVLDAQVYASQIGVSDSDPALPQAMPAIFRLFERFPEEDFVDGGLIHLLEAQPEYETYLRESLSRSATYAGVRMVGRILNSEIPASALSAWLASLCRVAQASEHEAVRDAASELIKLHAES